MLSVVAFYNVRLNLSTEVQNRSYMVMRLAQGPNTTHIKRNARQRSNLNEQVVNTWRRKRKYGPVPETKSCGSSTIGAKPRTGRPWAPRRQYAISRTGLVAWFRRARRWKEELAQPGRCFFLQNIHQHQSMINYIVWVLLEKLRLWRITATYAVLTINNKYHYDVLPEQISFNRCSAK